MAVVHNFDHHLASLMPCFNAKRTGARLSRLRPYVRRLDAMIDRVPHHVRQRIGQSFDETAIQSDFLAAEIQTHILTKRVREVAHHARQPRKDVFNRLQAGSS